MSLPAQITYANADPNHKPWIHSFIDILRQITSAEVLGDYLPYVQGSTTPSVDDQDKVWHKTDVAGRPLGTFKFYGGAWRREYTGLESQARIFFGDPALHFEANGVGIVGGQWDGWALMDGQGGRGNLSDKFLIFGAMDNVGITGYDAGWRTDVTGAPLTTGGFATNTLTLAQVPRPARPLIEVDKFTATGNGRDDTGSLYGVPNGLDDDEIELQSADAGNVAPTAITNVPPFYCLAIAQFIGYS